MQISGIAGTGRRFGQEIARVAAAARRLEARGGARNEQKYQQK
jgi:hypothetical protein